VRNLVSVGKIGGTVRTSRLIDLRKRKSVDHVARLSSRFAVPLSIVSAFVGWIWEPRDLGGGLLIHADLFAQTYFRLSC
jgi:hypothetical protein